MQKHIAKWVGAAVLSPILLFLIIAALLYLPPVQNWAARQAAAIASEKTGMDISVGRVSLVWPFNLALNDFSALHQNDSLPQLTDTIAHIGRLVLNLQLSPLLSKRVVIDELSASEARINTNGFISDLRIKGQMEQLWLQSHGIDLDRQTVEVNGARLEGARLDVTLSDTAAVDTTQTELTWRINADSITVSRSYVTIHLPGDTVDASAGIGHLVARKANIDLENKTYSIAQTEWGGGTLTYDNRWEPHTDGLDVNHISLTNISLAADSIYYHEPYTSFCLRQLSAKEQSGLELRQARANIRLDGDGVHVADFALQTADSDIEGEADIDFNTFSNITPGRMRVRMNAQIGKPDIVKLLADMPQDFVKRLPNHPLTVKGSINGNMQHLELTGIDLSLPTALHLSASGHADNINVQDRLKAELSLNAKTQDLSFITAAMSMSPSEIQLPPMTIGANLTADGNSYATHITATEGSATVNLNGKATVPRTPKGDVSTRDISYELQMNINNLNLHHFLRNDSIYTLSADISAKGHGTDMLEPTTLLTAQGRIEQLQYGHWHLDNMTVNVNMANGRAQAAVDGRNQLVNGNVGIDALVDRKRLRATVSADLTQLDLYRLRLVDNPMTIGLCGHVDLNTDMSRSHYLNGTLGDLYIRDDHKTYRPDDVGLLLKTNADTTYVRAQSGDLIVKMDGSGGYEPLLSQIMALKDSVMAQIDNHMIDQPAIKRLLPTMRLHVEAKKANPLANILKINNIDYKELFMDLATSPVTGINGETYLYSLNYDSLRLDTIRLYIKQKGERLTYSGQVRNNRKNPQFVFNTLFDGHLTEHGALLGLRYWDDRDRLGVRIGASAVMESNGLRLQLLPKQPTIGYKEFNLNDDNYILLGNDRKLHAKVDLIANDKTGLKIYTEDQDPDMLQDLTLSLYRFNLGELTSVLPYMPQISGLLNGDYHIVQDRQEHISVASDMSVSNMSYEGSPIGNLSTEVVYLQKEDDTHAVEARLMLDNNEFGLLNGTYSGNDGSIDATFTMTHLPLRIVNGFVPDQIIGLDGYGEGQLDIKGTTRRPKVEGEVYLDSAYLVSVPYGVRLRFDDDPVRIVGSHLLLENFGLYAYRNQNTRTQAGSDQPLNIMGDIDFSDTEKIKVDMKMQAKDFMLINSKQEARSLVFGKAFVNFFGRLNGTLDKLTMRGKLDVLGSTDMTYMLLDSPLSTDNRLDELVRFTDFSDSTQTQVSRPVPSGLDADLTLSVSPGAHIVCNLNAEQTNYIDLMGGGDLRLQYNGDGIGLTGRYTLSSGEMKYSLPVIPLKTFNIQDGSYVEFTGDPMNPRLNITATERTKATVGQQDGQSRSVAFDCGVVITKTLNDMGLQFIIDAPEDMSISGELATMSEEQRGKLAVTMLTTGMYLADGNTNGFSMNAALSSFLQSEINSITGSALKTLDLSVGLDNTTDASGSMHTDYSFRFSKRLWNNRLKIQIGGKVSSGSDATGQQQSFFDNVTMEYRLDKSANKYVKLFYNQNVYDWLEGYTGEYGIGFIWRRQLERFSDLFHIWGKTTEQQPLLMSRDSVGKEREGEMGKMRE